MRSSRHAARPTPRTVTRRGAWAVTALLAVLATALGLFTVPGALATGKDSDKNLQPYPDPDDRIEAQAPLLEVVDKFDAFLAEKDLSDQLVGVRIEDDDKLTFFWHGDVPGKVKDFLGKFSDRGEIEVVQVPHSREELLEEARRIIEEHPEVISAGPTQDFTAIHVGFRPNEEGEVESEWVHSIDSGMQIVPVPEAQLRALHGSRPADVEPFWGGAVITDEAGVTCSTGFAARKARNDLDVMISANHCDLVSEPIGSEWANGDGSRFVGRTTHADEELDTMLLTGADYESAAYVGPFDSNQGAPVQRVSRNVVGAILCNSGALTGEVCGNETVAVDRFERIDVDGGAFIYGPGFSTVNLDGLASQGEGDSGGPVVRPAPDVENRKHWALNGHGIISAGSSDAECQGVPDRACGTETFAIDLPTIIQRFELKLP